MTTVPVTLDEQIDCVKREIGELRRPPLEIPLRNGEELMLEPRDLWVFSFYHWTPVRRTRTTYLQRRSRERHTVHFHREIIGAPDHLVVDHVNGIGLDNRRSNLRLATRAQNNRNRGAPSNARIPLRGVDFHRGTGYFRARLKVGDTDVHCSFHRTPEEAARVWDAVAIKHFGEFAWQNMTPRPDPALTAISKWEAVLATLESLRPAQPQQGALL